MKSTNQQQMSKRGGGRGEGEGGGRAGGGWREGEGGRGGGEGGQGGFKLSHKSPGKVSVCSHILAPLNE